MTAPGTDEAAHARSPTSQDAQTSSPGLATAVQTFLSRLSPLQSRFSAPRQFESRSLKDCCDALLSSAPGAASTFLAERYAASDESWRQDFFQLLCDRYGANEERLAAAIKAYVAAPSPATLSELHAASEPRRQKILRAFSQTTDGTALLVRMRADALRLMRDDPGGAGLDSDFRHVFQTWFDPGLLRLSRLDWSASGEVLSRIIEYESVHAIRSWKDLRARLKPGDRRCYALFHPSMPDDPLAFVEVALMKGIPRSIAEILTPASPMAGSALDTAVFYSISNCHKGLRGIPFGRLLLNKAMDALEVDAPSIKRFVTLSPVPGFRTWCAKTSPDGIGGAGASPISALRDQLVGECADYLSKSPGVDSDPVARFHLGNGARLDQINWMADPSEKGMAQSYGIMVNYLYEPARLAANRKAFARGVAVVSNRVKKTRPLSS